MLVELETNVVAVERVQEYTLVPTEAPRIIPNNRPDKTWPQRGEVNFQRYSCRYRDGLPLVLNGITATVKAGEKVLLFIDLEVPDFRGRGNLKGITAGKK